MTELQIPRAALFLGLAGTLPFIWGAITITSPELARWTQTALHPRLSAPLVHISYGTVILAFMSGVHWGFATKSDGSRAWVGYSLSVIPALWAFFLPQSTYPQAAIGLMLGFGGLVVIDALFSHWGLTPPWWMRLRVLLTAIVVICLALGVIL